MNYPSLTRPDLIAFSHASSSPLPFPGGSPLGTRRLADIGCPGGRGHLPARREALLGTSEPELRGPAATPAAGHAHRRCERPVGSGAVSQHGIVSRRIPRRSEQWRSLGRTRPFVGCVRGTPRSVWPSHSFCGARTRLGSKPWVRASRHDHSGAVQVLLPVGERRSRSIHAAR